MTSVENSNFTKVLLLISECGTEVTKGILQDEVNAAAKGQTVPPSGSWTLDHFLHAHARQIHTHLNPECHADIKKIMVLYPGFGVPTDFSKWDLLLTLFVLEKTSDPKKPYLLFLNRLRILRNELCHQSKPVLCEAIFSKHMQNIKSTLHTLLKFLKDKQLHKSIAGAMDIIEKADTVHIQAVQHMHEWYIRDSDVSSVIVGIREELTHVNTTLTEVKTIATDTNNTVKDIRQDIGAAAERFEHFTHFTEGQIARLEQLMSPFIHNDGNSIRIQIPNARIVLTIQDYSPEEEHKLAEYLVKELNEAIKAESTSPTEDCSQYSRDDVKQALWKLVRGWSKGKYQPQGAKNECVAMRFACTTIGGFMDLVDDLRYGRMAYQFKDLEVAVQKMPGHNHFRMTIEFDPDQIVALAEQIVDDLDGHHDLENCIQMPLTLSKGITTPVSLNKQKELVGEKAVVDVKIGNEVGADMKELEKDMTMAGLKTTISEDVGTAMIELETEMDRHVTVHDLYSHHASENSIQVPQAFSNVIKTPASVIKQTEPGTIELGIDVESKTLEDAIEVRESVYSRSTQENVESLARLVGEKFNNPNLKMDIRIDEDAEHQFGDASSNLKRENIKEAIGDSHVKQDMQQQNYETINVEDKPVSDVKIKIGKEVAADRKEVGTYAIELEKKLHKLIASNHALQSCIQMPLTLSKGITTPVSLNKQKELVGEKAVVDVKIGKEVEVDMFGLKKAITQERNTADENYEERKNELRHALAQNYLTEHDSMPLSPLMPEVDDKLIKFYMAPKMNKVDTKSVHTTESVRSYKSVFYNDKNSYRNIYIQGEAGVGKSTFCKNLGLVWSEKILTECSKKDRSINNEESKDFSDENKIHEFDFVFSLALRNVEGECEIETMIEKEIINGLPNHTNYVGFVPKVLDKERCLIILDGLDEWLHRRGVCKKSGQVPHRKSWSNTTVLTSTRPWKMNDVRLKDSEISILIQITGIADSETFIENVLNCLNDKYQTNRVVTDFIAYTKDKKLKHFLAIPVTAMQMLWLWHSDHELGDSKCQMYLNMLDMLFGRAAEKSPSACDDITDSSKVGMPPCFESTLLFKQHIMLLDRLGSLAYHTLYSSKKEETLEFSESIVNSHVRSTAARKTALATGILSQHKSPSRNKRMLQFRFLHKTVQEFLVAYHIATHEDESENIVQTLFQVYGHTVDLMNISELFIFVCGLNPEMSCKISDSVMKSFSVKLTNHIEEIHVFGGYYHVRGMVKSLQDMIVAGYEESIRNGHPDPQLALHHVYYDWDISDDDKIYRDRLVDRNIDKIVTVCADDCKVDEVKIQQILTQSSSTLSHVSLESVDGYTDIIFKYLNIGSTGGS